MDYIGILKRAWNVTWKYKILWLFGLFAGAGGASRGNFDFNRGSGGSGGGGTGTGTPDLSALERAFQQQVNEALPLVVALIVLAFLIGLLFFVLSIAAQGALVHLVNEAEEGRPVRAGDGWSVGFRRWWRVLWLRFLVSLPIIAAAIVFAAVFGATIVGTVVAFSKGDAGTGAGVAGVFGACCGLLVFIVVAVVLGVILGVAGELGLRYAVLEDRTAWESLKQGWADLWAKRGAFLMYLVTYVTAIVFGLIVGFVALVIAGPAFVLLILGNLIGFAALMFLAFAISLLPSAIYATFYSSAWTIFFRRMTGREVLAAAPTGVPPAPAQPWQAPPVPPMPEPPAAPPVPPMPEPPAAPSMPEAPAPPAPPGAQPGTEAQPVPPEGLGTEAPPVPPEGPGTEAPPVPPDGPGTEPPQGG